ncbi:MAG: adenylyltransferase/cytidyltransferase family protein [Oscillospiraceae bacterium]|nr:adenylyltransferase/cytidyltransferase family protein [Oscillospiraceae bacterium]
MKKRNYDQLLELLDTLNEALLILAGQSEQDAINQLIGDIKVFVTNIINFINPDIDECLELKNELMNLYNMVDDENAVLDLNVFQDRIVELTNEIYINNYKPDSLKVEDDFIQYVEKLQWISNDHCIIIFSTNTPSGSPDFTPDVAQEICRLGTRINLANKFRASYIAIIDSGKLLAEEICRGRSLEINGTIENMNVSVKSIGYECTDSNYRHSGASVSFGNEEAIILKPGEKLHGTCGIAFIVYDRSKQKMIDFTLFDTYNQGLVCKRSRSKKIDEIVAKNPGVVFMSVYMPAFPEKNLTENEKYILSNNINYATVCNNPQTSPVLQKYISDVNDIAEVLTPLKAYIGLDGARHYNDYKGKYLNIVNGHRFTVGQPSKAKRTIYFIGPCTTFCAGARDEGTSSSQLQLLLNEYAADKGFVVENYGMFLDGLNVEEETIKLFNTLPIKSGDIVIGLGGKYHSKNEEYVTNPYKYGELFFDVTHYTEAVYKMAAEGIFKTLKENNFFEEYLDIEQPQKTGFSMQFTPELTQKLNEYKSKISDIYENKMHSSENVGAIVMNANPFTLGHRYLIEEAAKQCEYLLVFVVQEDKSFFPFKDRFELVCQGTKDLENVIVVESGEFIISSLTFEGYFNKSQLQDRVIDTSNDVTLFAKEIAPAANIKVRFAGSEPIDKVTAQYNRNMETILPLYNIEFKEIDRKTNGSNVISASEVRRLLKDKQWDKLREFVPTTTFEYLKEKFD